MTLQLKDFPGFNNVENNTRLGKQKSIIQTMSNNMGCRHFSVDSSAPTILPSKTHHLCFKK